MAPCVFQLSFQPVLCSFWYHPTTCCEDKGIEWILLNANHCLVVLISLFFMLLVDLCEVFIGIRLR